MGEARRLPQMPDPPPDGALRPQFSANLRWTKWAAELTSTLVPARCLVSARTNGSVDARSAAKIPTPGPARPGDAGAGADCRLLGGRSGCGRSAVCRRHLPQCE